jgi:L-fuconolactonase
VIVDGHLHLFRPGTVLPRYVDELAPVDRDAPVEELLDEHARYGIDAAVMVPLGPEDDYLGEVLRRFPDRFAGVAVAGADIEGRGAADPVDHLRRRREAVPFHGLRVGWLGDPAAPLADSPMLPVLRRLAADGLVLWAYLPADQLPLLEQLVRAVPDLPVVLNHLGFCPADMQVDSHGRPRFDQPIPPPTLPAVLHLARAPQVHVMVSGQYAFSRQPPPYPDLLPVVRRVLDAFGAHRALWASDWPWIRVHPGYDALLRLPAQLLPDASPTELADLMGGTTGRLFPHLQRTI